MVKGKPAKLVGIAETDPELVAEAQEARRRRADLSSADYKKMLDEKKPDIVWAFVENNRHLEIVRGLRAAQDPRHVREAAGVHLQGRAGHPRLWPRKHGI